jgi:hypothetical protein
MAVRRLQNGVTVFVFYPDQANVGGRPNVKESCMLLSFSLAGRKQP